MTRVPVTIIWRRWLFPLWVASMVPARRTIYVRRGTILSTNLLAHELVHVYQAERTSWPAAYVAQWIGSGFSYTRMPFEVEARQRSKEPFFQAWAKDLIAGGVR